MKITRTFVNPSAFASPRYPLQRMTAAAVVVVVAGCFGVVAGCFGVVAG